MKKLTFSILAAMMLMASGSASAESIILDLTKSVTPLSFDSETGAATLTYNDDEEVIESQCFLFLHNSLSSYKTWWGFTASNSANNSNRPGATYQWSNMAKGGIELTEDGKVKLDENGQPVVSASVPYIVAYYSAYMSRRPVDMLFNDDRLYTPKSVYVNLNTYAYYSVVDGDAYCKPFHNGDLFTLTIHGIAEDNSEKTVTVELAKCDNGDLTTTRGWKKVDLTSLGEVNELYFTMESTDAGTYGMNTPGYFCLDKLDVTPVDNSSVATVREDATEIRYLREAGMVILKGADFAVVYDAAGRKMMVREATSFSVVDLPAGVYIVKAGDTALKIAR